MKSVAFRLGRLAGLRAALKITKKEMDEWDAAQKADKAAGAKSDAGTYAATACSIISSKLRGLIVKSAKGLE